jgi:enamine deaminase RidA (YjgF/YER057c/UK114 family)
MMHRHRSEESETVSMQKPIDLRRFSNGTEFERHYGYCRAVRAGDFIFVSGTTARAEDLGRETAAQFLSAVGRIEEALKALGAHFEDIVRTVVYVRDMADVDAIAQAHSQVFGAHPPASTVVAVSGLTPDEARVEVEVTAVVSA